MKNQPPGLFFLLCCSHSLCWQVRKRILTIADSSKSTAIEITPSDSCKMINAPDICINKNGFQFLQATKVKEGNRGKARLYN
jgi:hypothetical protein